jgi:hypothetical protein
VLSVAAPDAAQKAKAERIMRESGATKVAAVERTAGAISGVDSASWTG